MLLIASSTSRYQIQKLLQTTKYVPALKSNSEILFHLRNTQSPMTLTPINDDGDNGSMHNAVLKEKYKKIKLNLYKPCDMEHNTPPTKSACSLDNTKPVISGPYLAMYTLQTTITT